MSQHSLALASKIAGLEQSQSSDELENHDEYQRLKQELQEFSAKAESTIESMVDQNVIENAYLDI